MFESWFKLAAAGADMSRAAIRTSEALIAADSVIRDRSKTIAAAIANPATADYAELDRLMPEKFAAAGLAAGGVYQETVQIWADAAKYWQSAARAAWGGGLTPASFLGRSTDLMTKSMALYAVALDPFHARVTSNARRLERKRAR